MGRQHQAEPTWLSRLQYLRNLHGLTIGKICRDTGLNREAYKQLERTTAPDGNIADYMKLAKYYGTSLDYIVGNDVDEQLITLLGKKMFDSLCNIRNAFDQLQDVVADEGQLEIEDITYPIRDMLRISDSRYKQLKECGNSIPSRIMQFLTYDVYPYNLLADIVGMEAISIDLHLTNQLIDDVETMLDNHLTEREAFIMRLRKINNLSQSKIAERLNLTTSRIGQIEKKSIRKLKNIIYTQKLLQSDILNEQNKQIHENELKIQQLENRLARLTGQVNDITPESNLEKHIYELKLSIRTYNMLPRVKINTVKDVLEAIVTNQIYKIRNIGIISVNELLQELKNEGILDCVPSKKTIHDCYVVAQQYKDKEELKLLKLDGMVELKKEIRNKYDIT